MKKIRIILLDDHQIVRDGLKKMIADESDLDLIGSVNNGKEALEFISHNKPDIVIADLSMPEMSGIEFTEKLNNCHPDVKVLILSMFINEDYILNAIKAGAKGYLPKQDSSTETLLEAIRKINSGGVYFPQSISEIIMKSIVSGSKQNTAPENDKKISLTCREKEILKYYADGLSNDEIAEKLNISVRTVKTHKNNIMLKYNFKSTVEMIKYALKSGLADL